MATPASINSLTDDLILQILWQSQRISRKSKLWRSIDPDVKFICEPDSSYHFSDHRKYESPIPTPPASADAALSLFNASVCQRWRRLAKDHVSTLLVRGNSIASRNDLTVAVTRFPNLTHLHLEDGSVDSLDDNFLTHLASSCPRLTALHVGWRYLQAQGERRRGEHPITPVGLDQLFQRCKRLQHLSIFLPLQDGKLPTSFFQLQQLQTLLLTDAAALANPGFKNLSSLTTLFIGFPWTHQHLACLAHLPKLAHLSLLYEFQTSLASDAPATLPSSLQSLKFVKLCPQFDFTFPLNSPLTRLEELLISKCNRLHRLPDGLGDLLPRLRKLYLQHCGSLVDLSDHFTSLTSLENFSILWCPLISSLPWNFGQLPALKVLDLSCLSSLSALPDSICRLSFLEALFLSSCDKISQLPAGLSGLTALKVLQLDGMSDLKLPEDIGELPNLQLLHLFDVRQEVIPPSFTQLSSLTDLEIKWSDISELPEGISGLQNLRELRLLSCTDLKTLPASLTSLNRLESLRLDAETMSDGDVDIGLTSVPERLDHLGRLTELGLLGSGRLAAIPQSLPPSLEVLRLGNPFNATSLPDFSLLPNLRDLALEVPEVECGEAVSRSLSQLSHLTLRLHDNAADLPFPLTFPLLRTLDIWGDKLERIPEDIGSTVPQLRKLDVNWIQFLEELPVSITEMRDLTSLDVMAWASSISINPVPASIRALPRLRKLHVFGQRHLRQRPPAPSLGGGTAAAAAAAADDDDSDNDDSADGDSADGDSDDGDSDDGDSDDGDSDDGDSDDGDSADDGCSSGGDGAAAGASAAASDSAGDGQQARAEQAAMQLAAMGAEVEAKSRLIASLQAALARAEGQQAVAAEEREALGAARGSGCLGMGARGREGEECRATEGHPVAAGNSTCADQQSLCNGEEGRAYFIRVNHSVSLKIRVVFGSHSDGPG
ncbi:hypothetical protein CLOP_g7522 [Closterium sp. NIES-67]|nr:hypothetical protein CLOP_g7522 [Closterium sp. NIES-67]